MAPRSLPLAGPRSVRQFDRPVWGVLRKYNYYAKPLCYFVVCSLCFLALIMPEAPETFQNMHFISYSQYITITIAFESQILFISSVTRPTAGGFKRAFKIKDFADTIPGHGGITDR